MTEGGLNPEDYLDLMSSQKEDLGKKDNPYVPTPGTSARKFLEGFAFILSRKQSQVSDPESDRIYFDFNGKGFYLDRAFMVNSVDNDSESKGMLRPLTAALDELRQKELDRKLEFTGPEEKRNLGK